ncbi:MAG: hypothetical protein QW540_10805 [Archaeoglobaceae archaeon]
MASEDELDELIREYFRELRKELCDSTDRIILLKILASNVDRCWRQIDLGTYFYQKKEKITNQTIKFRPDQGISGSGMPEKILNRIAYIIPKNKKERKKKEEEKETITFEAFYVCNPVLRYLVKKYKNFDEFLQKFVDSEYSEFEKNLNDLIKDLDPGLKMIIADIQKEIKKQNKTRYDYIKMPIKHQLMIYLNEYGYKIKNFQIEIFFKEAKQWYRRGFELKCVIELDKPISDEDEKILTTIANFLRTVLQRFILSTPIDYIIEKDYLKYWEEKDKMKEEDRRICEKYTEIVKSLSEPSNKPVEIEPEEITQNEWEKFEKRVVQHSEFKFDIEGTKIVASLTLTSD